MDISDETIARAEERAAEQLRKYPAITNVRYDSCSARIAIDLADSTTISVPVARVKGMERATSADIGTFQISPSGLGLRFPTLDADLYLPALLLDPGLPP